MFILHYMSDEDNEIHIETFEKGDDISDFMEENEIVESYSLVEGKILELG